MKKLYLPASFDADVNVPNSVSLLNLFEHLYLSGMRLSLILKTNTKKKTCVHKRFDHVLKL